MQSDPSPFGGPDMSSRKTWYILAPTFAVSMLLLFAGLGGAWYVHRANCGTSAAVNDNLIAAQAAERLVLTILDLREALGRFADSSESLQLENSPSSLARLKEELAGVRSHNAWTSDANGIRIAELSERLRQVSDQDTQEAQRAAARNLAVWLSNEMLPPALSLLDERQRLATDASRRNQKVARRIGMGLGLLSACGAVAGLLCGFGAARSFHRSLVEISLPVQDIAGRLDEVVGPLNGSLDADFCHLDDSLRILADKTADVVQRLQASQQKSLRQEQLAAIGQLAAGLAHELRNPLMSVKLIVQTAAERDGAGLGTRDLAVLVGEIARLEKLLNTFLDFARPRQLNKQRVEAGQLARQTLEVVRPRAVLQDVQLHFSAHHSPLWMEADNAQLQQVLLNLLLNALDVLPGGGNIWLTVARALQSHDAEIHVEDDGPGISADMMETAFEPFVSTKDTGIGLGLSICRQIIESHEGHIAVRDRDEGVAVFTICLPLDSLGQTPASNTLEFENGMSLHSPQAHD